MVCLASENTDLDIKSPCVRNCCLDQNDTCLGCHRTLSEIMNWSASPTEEKKAILAQCEERKATQQKKYF